MWVDCRTLKRPTTEIARQLLEEGHVWINEGEMYAGEGFPAHQHRLPPQDARRRAGTHPKSSRVITIIEFNEKRAFLRLSFLIPE